MQNFYPLYIFAVCVGSIMMSTWVETIYSVGRCTIVLRQYDVMISRLYSHLSTLFSIFDRSFARFLYEFLLLRIPWPLIKDIIAFIVDNIAASFLNISKGHSDLKKEKFLHESCETAIKYRLDKHFMDIYLKISYFG